MNAEPSDQGSWAMGPAGQPAPHPAAAMETDLTLPDVMPPAAAGGGRRRGLALAGLALAGVVIGALAVTGFQSLRTTPAAQVQGRQAQPNQQVQPNQQAQPNPQVQPNPQGGFGGPPGGGRDGEQRVRGTITEVTATSVTVKSSAGTATYQVTSDTQIVRNGAVVALSGVKVGDPVFVHVYPLGDRLLVERLFAGTLPQGGFGQGGPGPGPDNGQQQPNPAPSV
jgi:hypothetical protein